MDKGGAGKTVCQQSYRGRDRDEDLSEDAIIRTESEREREIWEIATLEMPKR